MTQSHSNTSCCCRNKFRAFKNSCVPSYTRTSYIPSLSHKFVLKNISDYLISVNNFLIFIMYNHKPFLKKSWAWCTINNVNTIRIQQNKFFHMKYSIKKVLIRLPFTRGSSTLKFQMKLTFLMSSSFRGIFSYEEFVYIVYFLELNHKAFYFDINLKFEN